MSELRVSASGFGIILVEQCLNVSGVCLSDPCIYGSCSETDGGNNYECECLEGFSGTQCEMIGDTCAGDRMTSFCGYIIILLLASFLIK